MTDYTPKTIEIQGKGGGKQPYLPAHEAITWFRAEFPAPRSAIVLLPNMETKIVRAEIYIDSVLVSSADVKKRHQRKQVAGKAGNGGGSARAGVPGLRHGGRDGR